MSSFFLLFSRLLADIKLHPRTKGQHTTQHRYRTGNGRCQKYAVNAAIRKTHGGDTDNLSPPLPPLPRFLPANLSVTPATMYFEFD